MRSAEPRSETTAKKQKAPINGGAVCVTIRSYVSAIRERKNNARRLRNGVRRQAPSSSSFVVRTPSRSSQNTSGGNGARANETLKVSASLASSSAKRLFFFFFVSPFASASSVAFFSHGYGYLACAHPGGGSTRARRYISSGGYARNSSRADKRDRSRASNAAVSVASSSSSSPRSFPSVGQKSGATRSLANATWSSAGSSLPTESRYALFRIIASTPTYRGMAGCVVRKKSTNRDATRSRNASARRAKKCSSFFCVFSSSGRASSGGGAFLTPPHRSPMPWTCHVICHATANTHRLRPSLASVSASVSFGVPRRNARRKTSFNKASFVDQCSPKTCLCKVSSADSSNGSRRHSESSKGANAGLVQSRKWNTAKRSATPHAIFSPQFKSNTEHTSWKPW
mmetsp:Transcript_11061/g.47241  ORF Transcript_11061/g.47241 Transcript_11061/m.47241 type:complete len:399 (-) Transcript_11061:574-1770(-)